MKKNYLQRTRGIGLTLLSFLCVLGIKAQTWTSPTLTGSTLITGTTYYIYNVGSNGYLNRGATWGAHAAVSAQPRANASTSVVKWTLVNTSGSDWTFQYNLEGSNVANNYLFIPAATSDGSIYTDNTANNTWTATLTDVTNNIYSIQSVYSPASGYLGSDAATESTNKGIASMVRYNRVSSGYTQWKFVTQADLDLYNAQVLLDRYMTYGKNKSLDITSYITTYNAKVTADINTAAAALLTALGRTDVTSSITNPSFETNSFTGWTNGSFAMQSNTPGQGWTKDGTYFLENYIASGSNLAVNSLKQSLTGLSSGLYELVVSGHAVQQAGANPLHTGAFITAGSQSTEVIAGQDYVIPNIIVAGTTLDIGYSLVAPVACNWTAFDNFRLYYYGTAALPSITATKTQFNFNGGDSYTSDSVSVSGLNLTSSITISAPVGITLSATSLPSNALNKTVKITYDGATTVNGNITLTSGSTTINIAVTGTAGASCYTPFYSSGNMIADPKFSATSLVAGGFGGWGTKGIVNKNTYCGRGSAYINGANSGSIDRTLSAANGNELKANTKYRLRAMINSKAAAGTYYQFEIEGVNGTASQKFNLLNTNGWKQFDTTFVTSATVTTGKGIYFNSYTASQPLLTDSCFLDNYELYEMSIRLSSNSLIFFNAGTKKVAVTGMGLNNNISISVPTGYSVSSSTLLSTVKGDSVAITYNGGITANGYVVFTSGIIKDSVKVTGTADPIIITTPAFLTFDELNPTRTFTVTAGNLADSVRFTLPSGFTVSRKGFARDTTGAVVTVTFNGTAESKGYITLTSGSASARVRVIGTLNSTNFTPLYSSGNLITDPYFNSLSTYTGWGGGKSITTDTTEVYSGSRSLKTVGNWANSVDFSLNGKIKPNSKYRLRIMANTVGTYKVMVNGFEIAAGVNDFNIPVNTGNIWKLIDTTFRSGITLLANQNLYINAADGGIWDGTLGLFDNYELYEIPNVAVSSWSLTFVGAGSKKVAVTGQLLTSDISITAPTGFSVNPSSLLSTVAGDSVAITFDGVATASGYVKFTSGLVKDSILVAGTANPALFAIDFVNETTTEIVPATVEYSTSSSMSSATAGTGVKISLTPGQSTYYRTMATGVYPASTTQKLVVPARPTTPTYTVSFVNETTNQVVATTDEFATDANMTDVTSGTGVAIAVTPAQKLYFRVKATASTFKSAVQTLTPSARPVAPTSPVEDDNANTFDWTNNAIYSTISNYEYSLDAAATWVTASEKPIQVGIEDLAIGAVQVRIKATSSNFKSLALESATAYTKSATGTSDASLGMLSIYPNPVEANITIKNLKVPATVTVLSVSGDVKFVSELKDNSINVENLPAGIYLLKLSSKDGSTVYKFIKK